jgi:signal transduction histidine kinase
MLRDDFKEYHPRRELVEILDKEVGRLNKVVEAFLENARQKSGSGPSMIAGEVGAVTSLLEYECRKRKVRIGSKVEPDDLALPLPGDLLRQVLLNLVLNSLQVLEGPGGVVTVVAWRDGRLTLLAVEDDGPGFPAAIIAGAAGAFFTTRPHGTGLGLAITREIVESHGGQLAFSNRSGGGARVLITFGAPAS